MRHPRGAASGVIGVSSYSARSCLSGINHTVYFPHNSPDLLQDCFGQVRSPFCRAWLRELGPGARLSCGQGADSGTSSEQSTRSAGDRPPRGASEMGSAGDSAAAAAGALAAGRASRRGARSCSAHQPYSTDSLNWPLTSFWVQGGTSCSPGTAANSRSLTAPAAPQSGRCTQGLLCVSRQDRLRVAAAE